MNREQSQIGTQTTFAQQSSEAKKLWNRNKSTSAKRQTFGDPKAPTQAAQQGEIRRLLSSAFPISGLPDVGRCHYCEQETGTDIEHVLPKSFFPNLAFVWENYVLACKVCNGIKLDQCYIFTLPQAANHIKLGRRGNRPVQPLTQDACFIQARLENPMNFLELDLTTGIFNLKTGLSPRDHAKAERTLEILELNDRSILVHGRREAFKLFREKLGRAAEVNQALNLADLQVLFRNIGGIPSTINTNQPLQAIKQALLDYCRDELKGLSHQTVWAEMISQRQRYPYIDQNFQRCPMALTW